MEVNFGFQYKIKFHPVGQGLFTSGEIFGRNGQQFNFIYDCGTSSSRKFLDDAISSLPKAENIDLVAISHFDNDHINGLQKLLNKHYVKILLIPYLSLEERLYIAFENKVDVCSSIIKFYIDPTKYLLNKFNDAIEKIILVPSTSVLSDRLDFAFNDDQEGGVYIEIDSDDNENPKVKILKNGGKIVFDRVFEFIPYNDSSVAYKITKSFSSTVNKQRADLLNSKNNNDNERALYKIRDSYDKCFGKSAIDRNVISMFLFFGPCLAANAILYDIVVCKLQSQLFHGNMVLEHYRPYKDCVLYTGDGYLNTVLKLQKLVDFLGSERISRIACLQVMHHGSSGSWYTGIAKAFSPLVSVFSSDPDHKSLKHPHAEVVRDFLPYHPVQVDQNNALEIHFYLVT